MSPRLGEEGHVPMARGRRLVSPRLGEEGHVITNVCNTHIKPYVHVTNIVIVRAIITLAAEVEAYL